MADLRKAVDRDVWPTANAASDARTWRSTRSETGAARRLAAPVGDEAVGSDRAVSSAESSSAAA